MRNDEEQISDLTARAIGGDQVAWGQLLRIYQPRVLGYIKLHMTPGLERAVDATDILQDVYLAVAAKSKSFTYGGDNAVLRWFLTLARRRIVDLTRELAALKRGGDMHQLSWVESAHESVIVQLQDLAVYNRTPSQSAVAGELRELMTKCVDQLSPDHREVLQLRYMQGISLEESAEALRRTPQAVSALCDRALRALRREMGQLEIV